MIKLRSGHKMVKSSKEETEELKKHFPYYETGYIRLNPGGWFYLPPFEKYANKLYDFKLKKTDVMISTFPKCGTTWTQEIVWTMVHNPNFDNPKAELPVMFRSPFIEFDSLIENSAGLPEFSDLAGQVFGLFQQLCPGKNPEDGILYQIAENTPDSRILKTHLGFTLLPPNMLDTCKVIYVARNVKDALLSYLHHHRIIGSMQFTGDLDTFIDYFMEDKLAQTPYWENINEAWIRKNHPNFHWIFFEDMKKNPLAELHRLNTFLGTKLSEEKLKEIRDFTSFRNMKARDPMFGAFKKDGKSSMVRAEVETKDGGFFRKGKAGDWKERFTPEQNAKLDDWIAKKNIHNIPFRYGL